MSVARVQSRGQVTIPLDIREACGIQPGSDLLFQSTAPGRFECLVLPARRSLREITEEYTVDGVAPDIDELSTHIAEEIVRRQGPARDSSAS